MNPEAMVKFLGRVRRIAGEVAAAGGPSGPAPADGDVAPGSLALRRVTHRTIDEVTRRSSVSPAAGA